MPPDAMIVRRELGIMARAITAGMTGHTTNETIARIRAVIAVPSVRRGAAP
jgi:hypothetical protein